MSIFGPQSITPTQINRVQINQSVLGFVIPVVMGKGRVQQTILWADGFSSKKINPDGGKGIGGGKAGTEYVYSADVIAAICNGGGYVVGLGDVWSGQSWLSTTTTEETYVITGGTPIYTPTNAATMGADHGVSQAVTYAGSYNDAGSLVPTTIAGSDSAGLAKMLFGTTLTKGQYSVDPSNNNYHFSPADDGTEVTLSYSFTLKTIKTQNIALVPSGRTVQVGSSTQPFVSDGGVVYATGANEGLPFTRVSSPTAAGQYSVSGSKPATYTFSSADINQEVRLTSFLDNSQALPVGTQTTLNFTLLDGEKGQEPWALLLSNFPDAALGYSGIALAAYAPMDLGYGAQIQQNTFEILTADSWGGGIVDCSPVQCIGRILTDSVWGLGSGPVPFPVSAIDNGAGGSWGTPISTGAVRQESTATAWFAANGFFISPVLDQQDTAASLISRWLEAGQCAAFMSEGLLKLVPLGDTTTAGNGMVWIAPQEFAADLDDSDFLLKDEGDDPVQITSSPWPDAFNHVQVNWNNRAQQYAPELTYETDQAAINRYGERIEDPQSWDFITTLPSATFAANMRVKRNVYIRNKYAFSLSRRYTYLEAMDVVRITTSSAWSQDNRLEIVKLPLRIRKVVDNPDGTIDFEAEEYNFGTSQPSLFNKSSSTGSLLTNAFATPGNTEAIVFEATSRLTGFQGNQLWMGACGSTPDWGSCNVYASMDGDTYKKIGSITTPSRLGVLGAALATTVNPIDTTNSMVVSLAQNSAGLDSGTTLDADRGNTLCFVDGELLSYSACAVSGIDQYTASGYLHRGQYDSPVSAHAAGSLFLRLDDSILKYTYDPVFAGVTMYLKFQSVNVYGNGAQDLSTLTAIAFTIPGQNPGTVDASTGIVSTQYFPDNAPTNVGTDATLGSNYNPSSNTATIFAVGDGPGSSWTYIKGGKSQTFPSVIIYGNSPGTLYYLVYDTVNSAYLAILGSNYQDTLNDNYIVLGAITTASSSGSTSGGYPKPGGGQYGCTVEGTLLDTPDGPVANQVLMERLQRGEDVFLSGRYGPERVLSAKWLSVDEVYKVRSHHHTSFKCSGTHLLRVAGHYQYARDLFAEAGLVTIETRDGYERALITKHQTPSRVLEIHLAGPSHEYSVGGVWTHNIKYGSGS